jgi:hypothetical protein
VAAVDETVRNCNWLAICFLGLDLGLFMSLLERRSPFGRRENLGHPVKTPLRSGCGPVPPKLGIDFR